MIEYIQHLIDRSAADKMVGMAKRGYSRDFPTDTSRRVKIEIDRVPPALAVSLKAKAKREGISIRSLTLTLWKQWVEQ